MDDGYRMLARNPYFSGTANEYFRGSKQMRTQRRLSVTSDNELTMTR
jgi:hypothetical protein